MASANVVILSLRGIFSPKNLCICRRIGCSSKFQILYHYSTSDSDVQKPVKFTTSNAAKHSFGKTMGIEENTENNKFKYEHHVIAVSVVAFLVYFCILREENDIDETLRGNPEYQNDQVKLIELQIKLQYCQANNIPAQNLEKRVEELKRKLNVV